MIKKERRHYIRKTLNPLPYIDLSPDSGGIVLDVSEQGLRFRATTAIEWSGPIHFSFTSQSNLLAGIGELVWIDKAKQTGGLRFTDLSYSALEQIRKWPHNSDLRPSIGKDLTLQVSVRGEAFVSRLASVLDRLLPAPLGLKMRERWLPALRNVLAKLPDLSPWAYFHRHNRWVYGTVYAVLLGILISTLAYVRHREAGELLIGLGMKLSGGVNTPTIASTATSLRPQVDDALVSTSKAEGPVAPAVPQSVSPSNGKTAKEISAGMAAAQAGDATAWPPTHEVRGVHLVVQVAALKDGAGARKLTHSLRQKNFRAFVGTLPVDSFYRVMLGPYTDEASARFVVGKLKRAGFNSFIRREPLAERLGS
jgi:cell division septation protein DedD